MMSIELNRGMSPLACSAVRPSRAEVRKFPSLSTWAAVALGVALTWQTPVALSQAVTKYSYDPGDHINQVTDPRGLVTTYAFDAFGKKWQQASADSGITSYSYDSYGRLFSMTRADGGQTAYAYDAINRRTSQTASGLTHIFVWDSCTNGIGRLCLVSDASGSTSYTYSPEGWTTGRGFSISGTGYSLGYSYNANGQVTSVAYPDGNQVLYNYSYGVISSVQVKVGAVISNVATSVSYQPNDAGMTQWTSGNGLINTLSYDTDGRLTGVAASGVQGLGLTYDAANRVTGIADGIDTDMSQYFGYDAMSRLVSVQSNADNETFQYDGNGNRTGQNNNGNAISFVITPGSNQVTNRTAGLNINYGYDLRGNLTTVSGVPYFSYDAFNRMSGANGSTYYVNPEGQRLQKVSSGVTSYFAPDRTGPLMAEYQVSNGWSDYIWLNGRLVARVNQGQTLSIHDDQLGRPEVMADSTKAVVWRARNMAFDRTILVNNAVPLNIVFPGQYYDSESNLSYNGFRDYSPLLGRYVESDPTGLAAGINTYAYVSSNPINNIDLLGLTTWHVSMFGASAPIFGPLGGTYAHFQATAKVPGKDCIVLVQGNVYGGDGGFALGLGWGGSQMDMDDGSDTFNPYALDGQFSSMGFQLVAGAGPAYGATRMGQGYSDWSWSLNGGIAFGSTAASGRSVITSVGYLPLH